MNIAEPYAYSFPATLQHTYDMVANVINRGVPGALIECGVGAGAQIAMMCKAVEHMIVSRDVVAFDSFEGIPMAGPNDATQPGIGKHNSKGELLSSGISAHSVENVRDNLLKMGIKHPVTFIKGWFQNTVHKWTDPIALLRLDGDLYESTKVCLQYLYPLVSYGGIVIIDDYALEGCRKACDEYGINEVIEVEGSGGVVWFRKTDNLDIDRPGCLFS